MGVVIREERYRLPDKGPYDDEVVLNNIVFCGFTQLCTDATWCISGIKQTVSTQNLKILRRPTYANFSKNGLGLYPEAATAMGSSSPLFVVDPS